MKSLKIRVVKYLTKSLSVYGALMTLKPQLNIVIEACETTNRWIFFLIISYYPELRSYFGFGGGVRSCEMSNHAFNLPYFGCK